MEHEGERVLRLGNGGRGSPGASEPEYPVYKARCCCQLARASTFRTFETCYLPSLAVRMPRLFSAIAMPLRLVVPEYRIDWIIGSTVAANRWAPRIETSRPSAAAWASWWDCSACCHWPFAPRGLP